MTINIHAFKLVNNPQPPCGPIYSPGPIQLKILKAYIKKNLSKNFIRPSKFLALAPIFFEKKLDKSLRVYIDY